MTPPRPPAKEPTAAELRNRIAGSMAEDGWGFNDIADLDELVSAVRAEALKAVTDAIEAAARGNSAQTQAAQDDGDDDKARMLILWGGGIVEALTTVRALVSK